MASIRKRKWRTSSGEDRFAWILNYRDQEGRRIHATFPSKREAATYRAQTIVEIVKGTHTPRSRSATVREAVEKWIEQAELDGCERSTRLTYRNIAEHHVLPFLGGDQARRADRAHDRRIRDGVD